MGVLIKNVKNNQRNCFELYLMFVLFMMCSYQKILRVDFFDDLFIIFIAFWYFIKKIKYKYIKRYQVLYLLFVLISCFISIIYGTINDFFVMLKIYVIIFYTFEINFFSEEHKKKNLAILLFMSLPNVFDGIYQFYMSHIKGIHLAGKYDTSLGYRLQGFVGHPIHYSLLLFGLLIISLYIEINKIVKILLSSLLIFLIYFTASEFTFVLSIICILIIHIRFLWNSIRRKRRANSLIVPVLLMFIVACSLFLLFRICKEVVTIRYVSLIGTIDSVTPLSFFCGHGIGCFTKSGFQEVYFIKMFYDTGLFGIGLLFYIVFYIIRKNINNENYSGIAVITCLFLNMIINDGYMIPFITMVPFFCSEVKNKKNIAVGEKSNEKYRIN